MKLVASAAVLVAIHAVPVAAQEPLAAVPVSLEHQMLLRCSAAFALVAHRQGEGDAEALAWPPMAQAGREFFVRATAQVMSETGLDREVTSRALSAEAQTLAEDGALARIMPACLGLLESDSAKSR